MTGIVMVANGRVEDAVSACVEGIGCAVELPGYEGGPLAEGIGGTLRTAYRADAGRATAAYRRLAGEEFPDRWK